MPVPKIAPRGFIYVAPEKGSISLRDYFAGQVLASPTDFSPERLAEFAYKVSDAMLERRDKPTLETDGGEKMEPPAPSEKPQVSRKTVFAILDDVGGVDALFRYLELKGAEVVE